MMAGAEGRSKAEALKSMAKSSQRSINSLRHQNRCLATNHGHLNAASSILGSPPAANRLHPNLRSQLNEEMHGEAPIIYTPRDEGGIRVSDEQFLPPCEVERPTPSRAMSRGKVEALAKQLADKILSKPGAAQRRLLAACSLEGIQLNASSERQAATAITSARTAREASEHGGGDCGRASARTGQQVLSSSLRVAPSVGYPKAPTRWQLVSQG